MKQRITYFLRDEGGINPATLDVSKDSLQIPGLNAAKEWRITAGVPELPQEIWLVLEQSHELHIRWVSSNNYDAVTPAVSRLPPGLHVFFTPRRDSKVDGLCPLLKKIFSDDLLCDSVEESFSSPPILSERFAMSSAFQYYQPLPSLRDLIVYVQQKACSQGDTICLSRVSALESAASVDMDFDTISHALTVNAYWSQGPDGQPWTETIRARPSDRVEVGILNSEKPTEPEELSLSGFLTVIGEDSKPSATMFSFPSRHHPLPPSTHLTFSTTFNHPTGLHPTLQLTLPSTHLTPPTDSCALHAYLTLPSTLFIDRYQLSDPLFLSSQNLLALRSLSGETDLEAPSWVVKRWGSAALVELATPASDADGRKGGDWMVSLPLHLRYLPPTPENATTPGLRSIEVPVPAVFWACEAQEGLKMSVNPFDRVNLGYDGLFGPKTMFYHVPPAGQKLGVEVEVPVLDTGKTGFVELGTAVVVGLGFAWVCWKLLGVYLRDTGKRVDGDGEWRKDR